MEGVVRGREGLLSQCVLKDMCVCVCAHMRKLFNQAFSYLSCL